MTRTKEEAHQSIMAFRHDLVSGKAVFADLASRESHCSSARRGGAVSPPQSTRQAVSLKIIAQSTRKMGCGLNFPGQYLMCHCIK